MKYRFVALIALVFGATLVTGCAATRTVGYVDPAYQGNGYSSFVTYAAFKDMALEARYERALCAALRREASMCSTMLAEAPPTRSQTAERRHRATDRSGADATVHIELAPHADSEAVEKLGRPGTRYQVTVFDNQTDIVVARFEVQTPPGMATSPRSRSATLAAGIVHGLDRKTLLANP